MAAKKAKKKPTKKKVVKKAKTAANARNARASTAKPRTAKSPTPTTRTTKALASTEIERRLTTLRSDIKRLTNAVEVVGGRVDYAISLMEKRVANAATANAATANADLFENSFSENEESTESAQHTATEVKQRLQEVSATLGIAVVGEILAAHKAKTFSKLKEKDFGSVVDLCAQKLNAVKEARV